MTKGKILVDGREFVPGKTTGISRFLKGLIDALTALDVVIVIASFCQNSIPEKLLHERIKLKELPSSPLASEKALSHLTKEKVSVFLSPYPKLPFFGSHCPTINTIHDILYLTHPAYRMRFKNFFERFRLKSATREACLTWYVSEWSLRETQKYVGYVGKNPRVRYPAIDERFREWTTKDDDTVLKKYHLRPGYIIVVGNGLPHKNLGILLSIAGALSRQLVFVGVSKQKQKYWRPERRHTGAKWIPHADDEDLPALIRRSFCLAQPSTAEGYGYPPLEAMACGIPAVVSNIPVLVETTGGQALTAHPSEPHSWIEAFNALEKREVYRVHVEKSLRWVKPLRSRIGWDKHIADIVEVGKDF